jgi:hypothetical protein
MTQAEDRSNVARSLETARHDIPPSSIPFLQATSTVNEGPPERHPSVHGEASQSRHVMLRNAK